MKLESVIIIRQRLVLFAAIFIVVSLIAAPWIIEVVEAACSKSCVYTYDYKGVPKMQCQQTGTGSDCSTTRWNCMSSTTSVIACNPCGNCHESTKTYTSKTPEVHKLAFPKYQVLLKAGEKLSWGDGRTLMAEKDGTLTVINKDGKPLGKLPAGSSILKGTSGKPEMVFLSGEPVVLLTPEKPISLR